MKEINELKLKLALKVSELSDIVKQISEETNKLLTEDFIGNPGWIEKPSNTGETKEKYD
jgi:hypothetical protein